MRRRHRPNGRKTMHHEILVRHLWVWLRLPGAIGRKTPAARAQNGSRQLEPNPTADSWFGLRHVYVTRLVPAPLTRMYRDKNPQTISHSHADHSRVRRAITRFGFKMWHFCWRHTRILYLHINMNNGHCLIAEFSLYRIVLDPSRWVADIYQHSLWTPKNSNLSERVWNETDASKQLQEHY